MANDDPESELWHGPIQDEPFAFPVRSRTPRFNGAIWGVRSDEIEFPDQVAVRDIQVHPGAVAILALNETDEIYLIRQYRHPVAAYLFETPAGLLDKPSEDPLVAAKRELVEEAGLEAQTWHVLIDLANSPGGSSEIIRFYLALDVTPAAGGRVLTGEAEEASLPGVWVDLDEVSKLVLAGDLMSPNAVVGVLAALAARDAGWNTLRPGDSPWQSRANLLAHNLIADVGHDSL